jgi:DNA-binding response OmpR family regulator
MPKMDGLTLASQIRKANRSIPIVMITAFTDTDKLLKATELNLTKYLVKPVEPLAFKEALAKIAKTLILRDEKYFHLKEGYIWDKETQELRSKEKIIPLLQKEKVLLSLLISKYRECVNFTDIMALVWEDDFDAEISVESVKFQVTKLRKKLPKESIKNVYGKGYVLE